MKSVNQIMIEGDDIEVGSESDISDTSQISFIATLTCQITWMLGYVSKKTKTILLSIFKKSNLISINNHAFFIKTLRYLKFSI